MTQPTTRLPNKLSALLRLAVQDAQKCEAMPEKYRLDMRSWHQPSGSVCAVCMAGSVIAQTMSADELMEYEPEDFGDDADRLCAINYMRQGGFETALYYLTGEDEATEEQLSVFEEAEKLIRGSYVPDDPSESAFSITDLFGRAPWPVYLQVADLLEGAGL
jgi:hypothetical protein